MQLASGRSLCKTGRMVHLTINTGLPSLPSGQTQWWRISPRSEVAGDVVAMMTPWTEPGRHELPVLGYSLIVDRALGSMLATVYQADRPVVTIAVAQDGPVADQPVGRCSNRCT